MNQTNLFLKTTIGEAMTEKSSSYTKAKIPYSPSSRAKPIFNCLKLSVLTNSAIPSCPPISSSDEYIMIIICKLGEELFKLG